MDYFDIINFVLSMNKWSHLPCDDIKTLWWVSTHLHMGPHLQYRGSYDHHNMSLPTQLTFIPYNYVPWNTSCTAKFWIPKMNMQKNEHAETLSWVPNYLYMGPHLQYMGSYDHHNMPLPTQLTFIPYNYVPWNTSCTAKCWIPKSKMEEMTMQKCSHGSPLINTWVPTYSTWVPMTTITCLYPPNWCSYLITTFLETHPALPSSESQKPRWKQWTCINLVMGPYLFTHGSSLTVHQFLSTVKKTLNITLFMKIYKLTFLSSNTHFCLKYDI